MGSIKIVLCLPVIMAIACLVGLYRNTVYDISSFQKIDLINSKSSLHKYYAGRSYYKIVIEGQENTQNEAGNSVFQQFTLYPYSELVPSGIDFDRIPSLLNLSSRITIWVKQGNEVTLVMGVQSEHLTIPPTQGVEFYKSERQTMYLGLALCLAGWVFGYISFRKSYNLDWKLNKRVETVKR